MNLKKRLFNKHKGFTLIELIVVIAIIGILVLLASPKFLGYVERTQVTRILHDTKVVDNKVEETLAMNKEAFGGEELTHTEFLSLINEGKVFGLNGKVLESNKDLIVTNTYKKISPEIIKASRTGLKGNFYLGSGGKMYYEHTKSIGDNTDPIDPVDPVDKTALINEIQEAKNLSETDYVEGWDNLLQAIQQAEIVNSKPTATDIEVVNAVQAINTAIAQLVKPDYSMYLATDADFSGETNGTFKYIGTELEVKIPHTIKGQNVTSYFEMFENTSVTKVISDNPNITDMSYMFRGSQATSLDLSKFNTSNVTTMDKMFWNSQATSLDLSSFNTSNVTTMHFIFSGSQAISLDLSSFDTSNMTNMGDMFRNSKSTSLNLRSFNTSKVSNMNGMFFGSQATSLDLSNFNTSKVTDMYSMFWGSKATLINLSSFDTSNVTDMSSMFYESKATSLDLSSFNTSNVTTMRDMFWGSKITSGWARTTADANKFNTSINKPTGLSFRVK